MRLNASRRSRTLLVGLGLAFAISSQATGFEVPERLTIAQARFDRTSYAPGETATLELLATVEDGWHVNSHTPTYDYLIPTTLTLAVGFPSPALRVTWPEPKLATFTFAEVPLSVFDGVVRVVASFEIPADAPVGASQATVTLGYQACDDRSCEAPNSTTRDLELVVGTVGGPTAEFTAPADPAAAAEPATALTTPGLLAMVLFGLIGGVILNLMPCVLPVLSLKVFGLVRAAGVGRREVVRGALATSAGIVASFLALAVAAVIARQAGAAVGWGVQFQHPTFLVFLLVTVALFALNLWGVFEITLPGAIADAADASSSSDGLGGHFASGLFATLMATPCSAPFLGTAVSFALGQPAAATFAVFAAVGIGMALPYLLLAASPGAARLLPRPGAWMDTLKGVLGFLLAGAGVWLLYVLAAIVSPETLAVVEAGLLVLALGLWLRTRGRNKVLGTLLALFAAVGTIAVARAEAGAARVADAGGETEGLIEWIPFDEATAEQLAAQGRLVFVDVTADWCLTCKVNERLVLARDAVGEAFAEHEVVAMKADWTRRDDTIAAYLAKHGRTGIPFYVLYRPGSAPHVFGEVLTVETVVDAVRRRP